MRRRKEIAGTLFLAFVALIASTTLSRDRSRMPTASGAPSTPDEGALLSPNAPAPGPAEPSRDISVTELPVADSSISVAKTKRFQEAKKCAGVVRAVESMRTQRISCDSETRPDVLASCKKRIASFDEKLERAEAMLSECPPADVGDSESRYWRSVVEAAEAGDADAALCYIKSDVSLQRPWSSEERARYGILAPTYIDRAFSAGDWRIAEIFSMGPRGIPSEGLLRTQTGGERTTQYRMNRLLRLGAVGQYAMLLDLDFASPDETLTRDERLAAEAWAKDMYARYFSISPKLDSPPVSCAVIDKDIWPYPF
jgi:hypothetical protein